MNIILINTSSPSFLSNRNPPLIIQLFPLVLCCKLALINDKKNHSSSQFLFDLNLKSHLNMRGRAPSFLFSGSAQRFRSIPRSFLRSIRSLCVHRHCGRRNTWTPMSSHYRRFFRILILIISRNRFRRFVHILPHCIDEYPDRHGPPSSVRTWSSPRIKKASDCLLPQRLLLGMGLSFSISPNPHTELLKGG